ncbi:ATP-binding protein, partial [Prunus dulcis]
NPTVEDAFNVFDRMLQMRPPPSVVRFNQILGQVAKLKRYSAFISLYNQMDVSGIGPDVYTLNILINCYCHLNQNGREEAAGIFNKMIAGGNCQPDEDEEGACKPDLVVYNTIIDSLCKDTLVDDAFNLFSEMMSKGIAPNVITYTSLIHGYAKGNQEAPYPQEAIDEVRNEWAEFVCQIIEQGNY